MTLRLFVSHKTVSTCKCLLKCFVGGIECTQRGTENAFPRPARTEGKSCGQEWSCVAVKQVQQVVWLS